MMTNLYLKDNYLDKNIPYVFNTKIIEYDLKSANTSLCREYNLLPIKQIEEIESMKKDKRVVTIGKLMRKDKVFKEGLKEAFIDIRRRFFEANNIEDKDILSIKKDAIFCFGEKEVTEFGACKFKDKNTYSSYMRLNNFEFYYHPYLSSLGGECKLDIKGIDDTTLQKHKGFMLKFFATAFKHFETGDLYTQLGYLKRFIDRYKHLELEVGYYREFNQSSKILLNDSEETYDNEVFIPYHHKQEHLNIDYNYFNILIPMVKMII